MKALDRIGPYLFLIFIIAVLLSPLIVKALRGPIVVGTECRTAGRNGDQLFFGAVDCANIEPTGE